MRYSRLVLRALRLVAIVVAVVLFGAPLARAQNPQRLPGVAVTAKAPPPGPRLLVGFVRDSSGMPIEGAEVTIPSIQKRLFSKTDGSFRFDNIHSGSYSIRARKLGFAAQVRTVKVESDGGVAEFALVPWPYSMPAVITTSVRGGLSGVIADTAYNPIPGVSVRILGKVFTAITDSLGAFYMPVTPGRWMVGMRKDGFAERVSSVSIPDDSGRSMRAMLYPAHEISVHERWNLRDLQSRQAWRDKITMPFYTHEDIVAMDIEWIYDLVRVAGGAQYPGNCYVTINGGPTSVLLVSLTVDDVDAVEVYKGTKFGGTPTPRTEKPGPASMKRSAFQNVPMTNAEEAALLNRGLNCPVVYVWLR